MCLPLVIESISRHFYPNRLEFLSTSWNTASISCFWKHVFMCSSVGGSSTASLMMLRSIQKHALHFCPLSCRFLRVCLASLSCHLTHFQPSFNSKTDGFRLASRICLYTLTLAMLNYLTKLVKVSYSLQCWFYSTVPDFIPPLILLFHV